MLCPLPCALRLPYPLPSPPTYHVPCRSSCAAVLTAVRTNHSVFPLSIPTLPCIVLHPAPFYATTLIFACLPHYPALTSTPALSPFSLLTSVLPPSRPPTCHYSVICALFFFLPSLGIPLTCPCACPALYAALRPTRRDLMTPPFPSSRLLLIHKPCA